MALLRQARRSLSTLVETELRRLDGFRGDRGEMYALLMERCRSLDDCRAIHQQIEKHGYASNPHTGNHLVQCYVQCGGLDDARAVFDGLRRRFLPAYRSLIAEYIARGMLRDGLSLYRRMGVDPDCPIFTHVLQACASLGSEGLEEGRQVHEHMKRIWLRTDVYVDTALLTMYAKCGSLKDAELFFHDLKWNRDVHFWNVMLVAYVDNGEYLQAWKLFSSMRSEGVVGNLVTYATALDVCSQLNDLGQGRGLHLFLTTTTSFAAEYKIQNALVRLYASCGSMEYATEVFEKSKKPRKAVAWNAMIAGYAQLEEFKVAIDLYRQMEAELVPPNTLTFASALGACCGHEMLAEGKAIHARADAGVAAGSIPPNNVLLQSALINMYGRCGSREDAEAVFHPVMNRDSSSWCWTAMVGCHTHLGLDMQAVGLCRKMEQEGVPVSSWTYATVLPACARAATVEDTRHYLISLTTECGVLPRVEHYLLMVDAFCRAEQLEDAEEILENMPFKPDSEAWMKLLSSCKVHRDADLGARAAVRAAELDPENRSSPYSVLADIYAALGRTAEAADLKQRIDSDCDRAAAACEILESCH